ncbi:MAG: phosphate ABC transporter substrate-binding protein PstS family protein [Nitrospinaceae bacterium]|nr:PstS family phosphate ABC transporter substrate-binding protein [Nitrospinaceae bacterium]NIR57490.1 PstS family phosphate ABC transporter substrate-binding protein [Nitrospinaceae bacterium]NIS87960.1 PstS family phosphate ABC transporter substrate-binding protein [Nitrospinaceae bacterium]NIT84825.1 PstS family phosphate ABC transporter substrate-binding protein [Nitrospinaceae bacterium]NIU47005.1 PstS family phosphate ABC transporter substrate-binding protein [Nitrospinaceae bacterium]
MSKRISICSGFLLVLLAASVGFAGSKALRGTVKVDGSSTVFPITEAVAEEFGRVKEHRRVRVTVGVSGTGGGFKKFLAGETDINDASRPIKPQEIDKAKKNGIRYIELPVAYDGLSVVVNKSNTWVDHLTVDELHKIWKRGSRVKTWKDIRPEWPNLKIRLYGPGTDSGTFDYFTETINGKSQSSRSDFTKSEDDNVLVQGVAGDKGSLGYFGFAYYVENKDKLKVVPIKQKGKNPVAPTLTTINNGSYAPLSRPIFIYVNLKSAKKPEIREFVRFYMKHAKELVQEVGYIPLPDSEYQKHIKKFEDDSLKLAQR